MSASASAQVRQYLEREVVPHLSTSIRAMSFEINSWLVEVHAFQNGVLDDDTYERLESLVGPLVRALNPRDGEPWQVAVSTHRVDAPAPIVPIGSFVVQRSTSI